MQISKKWFLIFYQQSILMMIATVCIVVSTAVIGQELQFKVETRLTYSEDNNQGIRRELIHQFKKDALRSMMSDPKTPQTKARMIDQHFDEMTAFDNVDKFFTKFQFRKTCDTRTGKDCGQVRDNALILQGMAYVSMNAIDNFLQSKSAAAFVETSDFATLFIARKVSARKVFDEKKIEIDAQESTSSLEVVNEGDENSTISGGSGSSMSVKEKGGSVELKADTFVYEIDLGLTEALQSAIQETLVNAGFEPFPIDDVLYDYDMDGLEEMILNGEFSEDGSLNRRTLAGIKKVAAEDGVTFLAIGRVDYRLGEKNPLTNDMQVPASVSVEVVMKKGRRMRGVAVVKPTQVYGNYPIGGDDRIGLIDAQNNAVKMAMDTIVSQMQSKGLY